MPFMSSTLAVHVQVEKAVDIECRCRLVEFLDERNDRRTVGDSRRERHGDSVIEGDSFKLLHHQRALRNSFTQSGDALA